MPDNGPRYWGPSTAEKRSSRECFGVAGLGAVSCAFEASRAPRTLLCVVSFRSLAAKGRQRGGAEPLRRILKNGGSFVTQRYCRPEVSLKFIVRVRRSLDVLGIAGHFFRGGVESCVSQRSNRILGAPDNTVCDCLAKAQ